MALILLTYRRIETYELSICFEYNSSDVENSDVRGAY